MSRVRQSPSGAFIGRAVHASAFKELAADVVPAVGLPETLIVAVPLPNLKAGDRVSVDSMAMWRGVAGDQIFFALILHNVTTGAGVGLCNVNFDVVPAMATVQRQVIQQGLGTAPSDGDYEARLVAQNVGAGSAAIVQGRGGMSDQTTSVRALAF